MRSNSAKQWTKDVGARESDIRFISGAQVVDLAQFYTVLIKVLRGQYDKPAEGAIRGWKGWPWLESGEIVAVYFVAPALVC
jgi:hypothetical protein